MVNQEVLVLLYFEPTSTGATKHGEREGRLFGSSSSPVPSAKHPSCVVAAFVRVRRATLGFSTVLTTCPILAGLVFIVLLPKCLLSDILPDAETRVCTTQQSRKISFLNAYRNGHHGTC